MGIVRAVFTHHKPENLRKGQDPATSIHQRNCVANLAANHSPTHKAHYSINVQKLPQNPFHTL